MTMAAGRAVIDIYPSMKGFKSSVNSELNSVSAAGAQTGSKLSSALSGAFKAAAAAAAAVSAVVVKVGKDAFQSYGQFEQLVGGVNKLFGSSASTVMANARAAFKTAGLSANQYMDNVMKFSASLIQSLGGDTAKAASIADTAIKDMSDNVNTFGSNVEDVQNAYQGFSKQNYTMLDNLRLGYGGTKQEMQRLLDDAEKISGTKYDISSFADIAQAIHVIQEEMAIAGTTTREAATTIEGSVATMKAAWQNLLIAMGSGEGVQQATSDLVSSIGTVLKNSVPVIKEIAKAIPQALGEAIREGLPQISEAFSGLTGSTDGFISNLKNVGVVGGAALLPLLQHIPMIGSAFAGVGAPVALIVGALGLVFANSEDLRSSFGNLFQALLPAFQNLLTALQPVIDIVGQLAGQIGDFLAPIIQQLTPIIVQIINFVAQLVVQLTPLIQMIVQVAGQIMQAILPVVQNLISHLQPILQVIMTLVTNLVSALMPAVMAIIQAVLPIIEIIASIVSSIISALMPVIQTIIEVITVVITIVAQILATVITVVASIIETVAGIVAPVIGFFSKIWEFIGGVFSDISLKVFEVVNWIIEKWTQFKDFMLSIFLTVKDWVLDKWRQIWEKASEVVKWITQKWQEFKQKINDIVTAVKNWFSEKWDAIKQKALDIAVAILTKWQDFKQKITDIVTSIKNWFSEKWDAIKQKALDIAMAITNKWNEFKQKINEIVTKIKDWFTEKFDAIKQKVQTIVDNIRQKWEDFKNTIGYVVSSIKDKITQPFENAKNAVGQKVDGILGFFRNLPSRITSAIGNLYNVGVNIINGIISGISKNFKYIGDWLLSSVMGGVNRVKSWLGIASPSKLMRDLIGENIMLGIGVGIEGGEAKLGSTFENTLSKALAFDPALGYTATIDYGSIGSSARSGVNVVNQTVNLYETDPYAVAAVLENRQNAALGV